MKDRDLQGDVRLHVAKDLFGNVPYNKVLDPLGQLSEAPDRLIKDGSVLIQLFLWLILSF